MAELIPPILENRPYIGEDVFKVYDGVEFYAVNHKGAVTFKDCSDLFYVFRPDDYMTTNSIPEWSKHILIEQNVPLEEISKMMGHAHENTTFNLYCGIMDANGEIQNTIGQYMFFFNKKYVIFLPFFV